MMSERAREVFDELAELPAGERERGLSVLGAEEAEEVRGLLGALELFPGFLETSGFSWREVGSEAVGGGVLAGGSRVGSFTIVREVDRGGMGVVYEAMQDWPRRRAAVKVMKSGSGSAAELRRFRREAEALGRANHPGIVAVYEAGMFSVGGDSGAGTPYIAMEFVDGGAVTVYAARARLDVRGRVGLMAGACRAVHHAHGVGVVHRDLSASNILVDGEGRVKIVDFGVARLSDASGASLVTVGDRVLGKWGYVSPEQAAGRADADHRTDVFGLGAVLYELLAGRVWLEADGRTNFHLLRAVEVEEPAAWAALGCAREGDLRAVVMTAMRKERGRRYPSALEFAEELERWLRGEAVIARPEGSGQRLWRFARANRSLSMAMVGLVVVLAAGVVVSSVLALRARAAEDRLASALEGVMRGILGPLSVQRSSVDAREATLESIREGVEQIKRARPGDRRVRSAAARYEIELGKLLGYPYTPNLGRRGEAVERFRAGLALLARDGVEWIEDEEDALLAVDAMRMIGETLLVDGGESGVEEEARAALAVCDGWLGTGSVGRPQGLQTRATSHGLQTRATSHGLQTRATGKVNPWQWLNQRCSIVLALSQALKARGDAEGAWGALREGEGVLRLHERGVATDEAAFQFGTGWVAIGRGWFEIGRAHECIAAMEVARWYLDPFAEPGRGDDRMVLNTGDPYHYIARSRMMLGEFVEAERACGHVLALCERVAAAYPERPDASIGLAVLFGERAKARAALGELSALGDAREAIRYRRLRLEEDPRAPLGHSNLARALRTLGGVCEGLIGAGCVADVDGSGLARVGLAALDEAEASLAEAGESELTAEAWMEAWTGRIALECALLDAK